MKKLNLQKIYQAYGYVRLSQEDDNAEESNSISNQKMLIMEFVKKREDINLVGFKTDDGCSGVTFDRKGFQELMEIIQEGKCDCLIVKDLSRFGRNYIESGKLIERLFPALGVRFIAINDSYDSAVSNGPADSMILPFKNLVNDMYSRDISIKVRSNFEVRRKKGDFVGPHLPYGYQRDQRNKGHFVIDKHSAEIVKQIFHMCIEGNSQQSIAKYLNQMGEPSPLEYKKLSGSNYQSGFKVRDKSLWSAQTVGRILRNEVYIGTMVQKKVTTINYKVRTPVYLPEDQQIRVKHTHEPIVDIHTFQLVQHILRRNRSRSLKGGGSAYLFTGILLCGRCGTKLQGQTFFYKDKKYIYYLCPQCQKSGVSNRIKEETLHELVLHALQNQITNMVSLDKLFKKISAVPFQKNEIRLLEQQICQKKLELEKYTKFRQSLYEDYIRGILKKEEMKDYYQGYKERCNEAEKTIDLLQRQMDECRSAPGFENDGLGNFLAYKTINKLTKGIVLSTLSAICIMDQQHVSLEFNFREEFERAGQLYCHEKLSEQEEA